MDPEKFIPTRQSLLSRLQNWEDQASWREFFDTYWRLIYSVALKSGLDPATAQDVVQETVLSVAQQMPGFRYDPALGSFKSWLMRITRRRIADHLRKHYHRVDLPAAEPGANEDALAELPDDSLERLERIWNEEWQAHLCAAALEKVKLRVKPEQFQMFDFSVVQALPVREVARRLQVSVMKVYLARHRVGNLVKRELARLEEKGSGRA